MKKQIWDIRKEEWEGNVGRWLKEGWEPFAVIPGTRTTVGYFGTPSGGTGDLIYLRKLVGKK